MRYRIMAVLSSLALSSLFCGAKVCAAEGVDDVIRMSRAGITEDVLLAYVQDSKLSYDDMSADEIQALQDNEVPSTVIVAMIDHGKSLPAGPVADEATTVVSTDTADTVLAPDPDDANISYFYQALAPDGRWQQVDEVGWCWQPRVAAYADWRPYTNDGHWVWSDAGWFFESDYRWGWAAFHYGRWHHHDRIGWVWVPGTEWAPAWVSWRESGSHYGWAPLPPDSHFESGVGFTFHSRHVGLTFDFGLRDRDYTFVAADRFLEPNLAIVALAPTRNHDVYQQTTIVNNTYVYNNNRIVNNGVSVRQVQQRTNKNLEPVVIADAKIRPGEAIRGERREKNSIAVFRPKIEKAAPKDPPAAIAKNTYVKHDGKRAPRPVNTASDATAKSRVAEEMAKRKANPPMKAEAAAQRREANKEEAQQRQAERQAKQEAEKQAREQAKSAPRTEPSKPEEGEKTPAQLRAEAAAQRRDANKEEAEQRQAERQAKLEAEKQAREQAKSASRTEPSKPEDGVKTPAQLRAEAAAQRREANKEEAEQRQAERQAKLEAEKQAREEKREEQKAKRDDKK